MVDRIGDTVANDLSFSLSLLLLCGSLLNRDLMYVLTIPVTELNHPLMFYRSFVINLMCDKCTIVCEASKTHLMMDDDIHVTKRFGF